MAQGGAAAQSATGRSSCARRHQRGRGAYRSSTRQPDDGLLPIRRRGPPTARRGCTGCRWIFAAPAWRSAHAIDYAAIRPRSRSPIWPTRSGRCGRRCGSRCLTRRRRAMSRRCSRRWSRSARRCSPPIGHAPMPAISRALRRWRTNWSCRARSSGCARHRRAAVTRDRALRPRLECRRRRWPASGAMGRMGRGRGARRGHPRDWRSEALIGRPQILRALGEYNLAEIVLQNEVAKRGRRCI